MAIEAFEMNRTLHIDLGGDLVFKVPPVPGSTGIEMLAAVTSIAFGARPATALADTERLVRSSLGLEVGEPETDGYIAGIGDHVERDALFNSLRAQEQEKVSQAAIVWNVQGGSMEAVYDVMNTEPGAGYPKALGRVMQSCGLAESYEVLRNWLNTGLANQTSAANTSGTNSLTGIANTSNGETSQTQAQA